MKHIKLQVLRLPKGWGKAVIRIVSQSHRGKAFGNSNGGADYVADNGIILSSSDSEPFFAPEEKALAVRGPIKLVGRHDWDVIWVENIVDLNAIIAAVREYNEYFSDKPKAEPKPETGTWTIETVE
jgi:hypothetical protein